MEKSVQMLLAWNVMNEETGKTMMREELMWAGEERYRRWWKIWSRFLIGEEEENTPTAAFNKHIRKAKAAWRRSFGSDFCTVCLK